MKSKLNKIINYLNKISRKITKNKFDQLIFLNATKLVVYQNNITRINIYYLANTYQFLVYYYIISCILLYYQSYITILLVVLVYYQLHLYIITRISVLLVVLVYCQYTISCISALLVGLIFRRSFCLPQKNFPWHDLWLKCLFATILIYSQHKCLFATIYIYRWHNLWHKCIFATIYIYPWQKLQV